MIVLKFILFFLLAVAIILTPMFGLYYVIKFLWERFVEPPESLVTYNSQTYTDHRSIKIEHNNTETLLTLKFNYYQKLNDPDKAKFLKRISKFISDKEFRALGGLELTEEMIILISASAIQLTFGLEEFLMDHFSKIFIYPKEFYSRFNKEYHKGETNLAGVIVLSWKHFNEGYAISNDNLNLGLHEMAHALRFDKFKSDDYDKFFSEYIDKWQLIANEEFKKLKNKESSFLRAYAGTNFGEFFSVCVEYFFESPKEFKNNLPEIYKHLCILLNQDPAINAVNINVLNTQGSNSIRDLGNNIYSFKSPPKNILLELIVLIPLIVIAATIFIKSSDKSYIQFYFIGIMAVLNIIGRIIRSRESIELNTNGIKIISGVHSMFDSVFYYDEMVSVVFRRAQERKEEDSVKINRIKNGKIKQKVYTLSFSPDDMQSMGNYFTGKKIPVKFDGFDIQLQK